MLLQTPLFRAMTADHSLLRRLDPPAPVDVYQRDEHMVVHMDLPGVSPDTLNVSFENGWLSISAERSYAPEPTDRVVLAERSFGKFERRFRLSTRLDLEHARADLTDGVLTVTIPVATEALPQRIEVQVARNELEPSS